jgi:hypothetical protein
MKRRLLRISLWFFGSLIGLMLLISGLLYFFKDEICGYAVNEVNKHLKAKVSVSEVDLTFWGSFPSLSVDFNHVFIQDSYVKATVKDTLLYSDRIRMKFDPMDIWEENYKVHSIEVAPGTLQLKVNKRGEVNYDILKETSDTTQSNFELALESVALENVRFAYKNRLTGQHYSSRVDQLELNGNFDQDRFDLATAADLTIEKIKSGKVTLISNQPASINVKVSVDKLNDIVSLPKATISIAELPFEVSGLFRKDSTLFELHSKDIPLTDFAQKFAVSGTDDIKKYKGAGVAFADITVKSSNDNEDPARILCDFGITDGELTEPGSGIRLSKIAMEGRYSNVDGKASEYLELKKLKFQTPGGPFKGDLRVTQFQEPRYEGSARGIIDLRMLHSLFGLPMVEKIQGQVDLSTDFDVRTIRNDQGETDFSVERCEGNVELEQVVLKLKEDQRTFRNVSGALYLRGDEAGIDHVSLNVGESDLKLDGVFKNIVPYLEGKGALEADVAISGNRIDLQDLGTTTKEEKIQEERHFVIPDNIHGNMQTDIGELKYEKHRFLNVSGSMQMTEHRLLFPSIQLENAEADIAGSVLIEEKSPEIFTITTEVQSDNLEFKPLFHEWDNFNQSVIGEENIFGKAQSKVYFSAPFDLRSGIISKAIKAQVYLKITDGKLKNVNSFKSITESLQTNTAKMVIGKDNIALLEKKLMDLRFETLENTFTIQDGKLTIPEMMIHTSALDVETSGTHTFENMIDYRFAFRFRDLKDKSRITEFGEEVDDGTGMKVYMRMYGPVDKPTIVWDKTSRKQQLKEDLKQEKETVKSMLKSEFGLFKNDSTVKSYQEKERPKETIKVEIGSPSETTPGVDQKKQKKDSKLKNTLKNWKEEADKDKEEKIEFN